MLKLAKVNWTNVIMSNIHGKHLSTCLYVDFK